MPATEIVTRSDAIRAYIATNPGAKARQIAAALREQGIDVKENLVHKVMQRDAAKAAGKRRKRPRATSTSSAPAVRITGTDSIRDYLRRHPGARPRDIRAGLEAEGIKVSQSLVHAIKYRMSQESSRPSVRAAARRARPIKTSPNGSRVTIEQLFKVKQFVDELGGLAQVRQALDTLDEF